MLFPGHERSRDLLGDLATEPHSSKDQEPTNFERDERYANPSNLELMPGEEQRRVSVNFALSKQKQDAKEGRFQTRATYEDWWPNGAPPTGPRKYVQRTTTYPRRESSTNENGPGPTAHGLSSTWIAQRPPSSLVHRADVSRTTTPQKADKVMNGPVAALWCAEDKRRIESCMHDASQVINSIRGKAVVATSETTTTTTKGLRDQTDGTSDVQPHRDVGLTDGSPPKCVSSLNQRGIPQVPRSEPHSLPTATESPSENNICLASITYHPVNKAETSTTSSPSSALGLHRDIAYVRKHSQRCSSEAASVISTTSSVAGKSSSSSISSTSRLSICHVCKKPPFKERLKGCSVCSRHYHKGCAKPKDRITEDTWMCRRCLNKVAKRSESTLPSSSKLFVSSESERAKQSDKVSVPPLTPIFTHKSSMREVTAVLDPPLTTPLRSANFAPNKKTSKSREILNASAHVDDVVSLRDHSPDVGARHDVSSNLRYIRKTENSNKDNTSTVKTFVKDVSTNPPTYLHSWLATGLENTMETNALDTKDSAPPSLAAAPFLAETAIRKPWSPLKESLTSQLPPAYDDSAMFTKTAASSSGKRMESTISSAHPKSVPSDNKGEVQRHRGSYTRVELNISETPRASGPHTRISPTCIANSDDMSRQGEGEAPKNAHEDANDNMQLAKKLCSGCQRPILGSTSMCMNCRKAKQIESYGRSKEYHSNGRPHSVESPKLNMAASDPKPCLLCSSNKCKCVTQDHSKERNSEALTGESSKIVGLPFYVGKSHQQEGLGVPLPSNRNLVPASPFVPETPGLATEKLSSSLRLAHDDKATPLSAHRIPKPLIPQKRPFIRPLANDNEHCFSKKKPRIYKPITEPIAVNIPPKRINTFPPTPKSDSPHSERNLRDAGVQASVETVHRGTSPGFAPNELADRLDVSAKRSASPGTRLENVALKQRDIPLAVNNQYKAPPFRIHPGQKSQQRRSKKQSSKVLEQQARELAWSEQEFGQAEAAIARLQRPIRKQDLHRSQDSIAHGEMSGRSGRDLKVIIPHVLKRTDQSNGTICKWTSEDEKELVQMMQNRGVIFEDDSSSGSDVDVPVPRPNPVPKDPLWRGPQSSKDLFAICPRLDANYSPFDVEVKRKEIAGRPTRKERRLNISYLRKVRGDSTHEEVKRTFPPRLVKVPASETSEMSGSVDKSADGTGLEPKSEVEMTFQDFIGALANPMAILTKDKELAFRDGTKNAKGVVPRARRKFIVTSKSVACMER